MTRVCAVSYLNTVPLIWGMLHGPQKGLFDLSFTHPAGCADRISFGQADIGIVPVIEIRRQRLRIIPGTGIASHGAVRSILLISRKPPSKIQTLAADHGSRTSVLLARILLMERYGSDPRLISMPPDLDRMLEAADAALLIGDAALRHDPQQSPYQVLDLGAEWTLWTGLPMVFALWAGPEGKVKPEHEGAFRGSCRYGLEHLDEIIAGESARRGFPENLVRRYLTRHIVFELGDQDYQGLDAYLGFAARLDAFETAGAARA